MENIYKNVSSFNENEVTQLLLKALEISNEKSLSLMNQVSKLQEKINEELNNRQKAIAEIEVPLKEEIAALHSELESIRLSKSSKEEEFQTKFKELNTNHENTISIITSKHDEELNKKNIEIQKRDTEISTIKNESECFKVEILKFCILNSIERIRKYSHAINKSELDGLKKYIAQLCDNSAIINKEYNNVDALCRNLLNSDGIMCYVCNLIWWLNNSIVLSAYKDILGDYEYITEELDTIIRCLKKFNYDILVPHTEFCDSMPEYDLYDNSLSHIRDIFPAINLSKSLLCEIYTLSYNGKTGKCYSL